jgi:hypothetical protein
MRYMLESPYGRWSEDGTCFVYDLEKIAHACGYTIDEVKAYGVIYCRQFRRTPSLRQRTMQPIVRKTSR